MVDIAKLSANLSKVSRWGLIDELYIYKYVDGNNHAPLGVPEGF